jgi:hypothetical protein
MRAAYHAARRSLPAYRCKFSRKDFTLPQLFACLVLKEHQKKSYRQAEALLADSENWLKDIGLKKAPDHNTLWRAADHLLRRCRANRVLDTLASWAAAARILGLSHKPLAADSSMYESRPVSRHYERRCRQQQQQRRRRQARRRGSGGAVEKPPKPRPSSTRARTTKGLPKLAVAVAGHCHLILGFWTGTGLGPDHGHFAGLLRRARARIPHRHVTAVLDAGYDSEPAHELAREELGVRTIIPPEAGRPRNDGGPPGGRWRRHMARLLATKASRRRCGYTQRSQSETVHSMIKRNLGSALRGRSAWSRKRDLALKVLTHNVMIL